MTALRSVPRTVCRRAAAAAAPAAVVLGLLLAGAMPPAASANEVIRSGPSAMTPSDPATDPAGLPEPVAPIEGVQTVETATDIDALASALVAAANAGTPPVVMLPPTRTPERDADSVLPRASLRPDTTIERPFIHLGDLFGGLPEDMAAIPVGHAPEPGERLVLDARHLGDLALEYGVDWTPASRFLQAVVHRRGYEIGRPQVLEALRARLLEAGMPEQASIDVSVLNVSATVGTPDAAHVAIRDLYYDQRTGRFNALVDVPADGPQSRPVRLTGAVHVSVDVPVLARPLRRGMVVAAEDVRWDTIRRNDLRPDILLDPDDLIGMAARRGVQAGTPVRANQLVPPEVVSRNGLVTMVLETPFMTVTARGRALEAGAIGDTVRIANLSSDKEVLATVAGRNTVRVQVGMTTAALP